MDLACRGQVTWFRPEFAVGGMILIQRRLISYYWIGMILALLLVVYTEPKL